MHCYWNIRHSHEGFVNGNLWYSINNCKLHSVVGIPTRYALDRRGSNHGGREIFRTHPHRPWGSPSLLYNGYRVCYPGVRPPGRGVDHPPPSRLTEGCSYSSTLPTDLHGLFWGQIYICCYIVYSRTFMQTRSTHRST
jgi:hypothetical protein